MCVSTAPNSDAQHLIPCLGDSGLETSEALKNVRLPPSAVRSGAGRTALGGALRCARVPSALRPPPSARPFGQSIVGLCRWAVECHVAMVSKNALF